MKKILLRFDIRVYHYIYYPDDVYDEFEYSHFYNETITFNDVLKDIYIMYSNNVDKDNDSNECDYRIKVGDDNLFSINYSFKNIYPEPSIYNYKNIRLKNLEWQFGISKHIFYLHLDPCFGDCVGKCKGIHFYFHTNEKDLHHVPHIHCKYGKEEFRVNLITLKIMDKPFRNRKRAKLAISVIEQNQKELIRYWEEKVIKGEKVKFAMYIPN